MNMAFNNSMYDSSGAGKIAAFVVGSIVALHGTGSIYDVNTRQNWLHHIQARVPVQLATFDDASPAATALDVRSAADHLADIRQVLDPSISDMASLFDVSRQMVYKWMAGDSEPSEDRMGRIKVVSQVASIFAKAKLDRPGSLLKIKAFDGKSLFDLLKSDSDIQEPVNALIAEAIKMDSAYQKSGLARTKASPSSDWQSHISVPGSIERT